MYQTKINIELNLAYYPDRDYVCKDVKRLLGISRNELFYWINTHKLLTPKRKSKGTGEKEVFSAKNMRELEIINALYSSGLTLKAIREYTKWIRMDSYGIATIDVWNNPKGEKRD